MKISFKLKLFFSYICVILASFGSIAFFLDKNLEENSLHSIQSSLIIQANLIESQINRKQLRQEDIPHLESLVKALKLKTNCRITIINNKGRVLADSDKTQEEIPQMENHLSRPEVKAAFAGETGINTRYSATLKFNMLYVALPIRDNAEIPGVIRLSLPLEGVQKTLFAIRKIVIIGLAFALIFAFILGSILSGRTINQINRMIQVSRKFSRGDFSHKIIRISKDEVGELAFTLNKMAQDIEDKIKETKAQNQKLAVIFDSMIEGVIVIDKTLNIISINPAVEKIFNVSRKNVEGKAFLEAIRNNDIYEIISNVLFEGKSLSAEIALVLPVHKTFEINATPIFDTSASLGVDPKRLLLNEAEGSQRSDNNIVIGCLVVIHDITEIKKLETIRKDFVANVSHELKTPLTSIKGFVETLLEGAIDDKENNRNFLKIIRNHTERLDSLVKDLLSLSQLESKEIILKKTNLNLNHLVEDVISGFKSQIKKKNIEIKNELANDIFLAADKDKIEQVLTNLIDNAIKFNKENGIIRIYCEKTNNEIKIYIEDSGIGIPVKDISRIFERFYRVDKARSRELGGTGLGLSIAKHIVELHDGTIGAESVEDAGSKFWFTLPK